MTMLSTENGLDIWYGTEYDPSNLVISVENIGDSSFLFFDGQKLELLNIENGINFISLSIESKCWGFILFNQNTDTEDTTIYILHSQHSEELEEEEEDRGMGMAGGVGGKTGSRGMGMAGGVGGRTGSRETTLPIKPIKPLPIYRGTRVKFPTNMPYRPSPKSTIGVGRRELDIKITNLSQFF